MVSAIGATLPRIGKYPLERTLAAPDWRIHGFGKIRYEKCEFKFRTLFKQLFSTLSIFPRAPSAYFYDIFDQNFFDQNQRRNLILKLGGSTQKWGLLLAPNSPHTEKSSKILEIGQVLAPSQCLVGAGNHIWRAPNAPKTS